MFIRGSFGVIYKESSLNRLKKFYFYFNIMKFLISVLNLALFFRKSVYTYDLMDLVSGSK